MINADNIPMYENRTSWLMRGERKRKRFASTGFIDSLLKFLHNKDWVEEST
jgi:hypothetical protein